MKLAKRILLFLSVNFLIVITLSVLLSFFGIQGYVSAFGIDYRSLMLFCLVWGFGGAFISLALSRIMAKMLMGVKLVDPETASPELRSLVARVHQFATQAGLQQMPEVGIYESNDLNAFATGPSKSRSLVAVSTGLVQNMSQKEVDGVLAHEVAHIANGDMVTMTLVQGVVNAFVMFLARVVGFFVSQFVDEQKRPMIQFAVVILLEIVLGILGMLVVSSFSRRREFRADAGGAEFAGRSNMIAALQKLKQSYQVPSSDEQPAIASLKINGKAGGFLKLFSTHPDLDDRIARLKEASAFQAEGERFQYG